MTHATHATIRSLHIEGPAGKLEAVLNMGKAEAQFAAVVAHPHPLFGGTMHNKVVFHAMKALNSFGFPVLRFNFRGVGTSEGEHDFGNGEVDDVRRALEFMKSEFGRPLVFAGFSFGAATGMRASAADDDVKAIVSIGTPMNADGRVYEYEFLSTCTKPKLLISGEQDQFATPAELSELAAHIPEPKRLVLIPGADHFFAGHLDEYRSAVTAWIEQVLLADPALAR